MKREDLVKTSMVGYVMALYRGEDIASIKVEPSGNEYCQLCESPTVRIEGKTMFSAPSCLCEDARLELTRYIDLIASDKERLTRLANDPKSLGLLLMGLSEIIAELS